MALVARNRPAESRLGQLFADVRLLHAGPRFALYEGRDVIADRAVTFKVSDDVEATWLNDVLAHEATVLAALGRSPHVIRLQERIDLEDGRPVLVLDHCAGSVADTLGHGAQMNVPAAVALGIKIASALDAAHAAQVLHRDVRPHNVLVSDAGEPVLAGFDESVRLGDTGAPLHITTGHTAPEMLEGQAPTVRSDVYGLASTLYELIAGQAAFRAYAGESPATIIIRVLSGRVKPLVGADVPLELSDLLTWAMAPDQAERVPSPAWLAEELGRIESRQGWPRTRIAS